MQKYIIFTILVFVLGRMAFLPWSANVKAASLEYISRGEAVSKILQTFDLRNKEKVFINDCYLHLEDCFFVFGAMSHFDAIGFKPLVLYPDVSIGYRFYDDIVLATMLGLVHGHLEEKNSPFYPRAAITRIHALKIILGAAKLLPWKEKFEIAAQIGDEKAFRAQKTLFIDIDPARDHMWWYFRYTNFTKEFNFTGEEKYFRPDDPITRDEFENFLKHAAELALAHEIK